MSKPSIAIIGAGLSGLILANKLADQANVTIFEKSRGVGGRMATRHAKLSDTVQFDFDHGTQFFTAKTPEFKAWLAPLQTQGLIAEWTGNVITIDVANPTQPPEDRPWPEPHYVGHPNMNSLAKYLAKPCTIELETEIARLPEEHQDGWLLTDKSGAELGLFDWVISTAPPVQTMSLFATHLPAIHPLEQVSMQGCFTLMLGFNKPWDPDQDQSFIAAKTRNSPIEWIAINSSKPERNRSVTSVVIHTSNAWAQQHLNDDLIAIQEFLLDELAQLPHLAFFNPAQADHIQMHRWRYALKTSESKSSPYLDPTLRLASTGDWCRASRIEDVWLSAHELAKNLRTLLTT